MPKANHKLTLTAKTKTDLVAMATAIVIAMATVLMRTRSAARMLMQLCGAIWCCPLAGALRCVVVPLCSRARATRVHLLMSICNGRAIPL